MPISTLWAKSMPSTFSRKPWTKCWRACSPSVTISTPAPSCSFTASMVASRLARASSAPVDFQGAHSVLGSASHSGLGKEPAIVVGNSMGASRSVLIERLSAMSYDRGTEQQKSSKSAKRVFKQNPAWGARKGRGKGSHDRPALRADAQRLENLDHAGGTRAALSGHPRQHPGWRAVQTGISGDQPEQPHSGYRGLRAGRWRRAVLGVRDWGDLDLPRRQDRALSAEGNAGALPRHGMADVADEWAGAHARPARPFRALRGGQDSVRDRALPRRGGAALPRARYATRQDRRLCRRGLFDRRHRLFPLDHDPQGAGLYARRLSERETLVRRGARTAAGAGGACDRQVRERAVRRGITQDHVRTACQGSAGKEVGCSPHRHCEERSDEAIQTGSAERFW